RSEEHTAELQSHLNLVCRLLLERNNVAPAANDDVFDATDDMQESAVVDKTKCSHLRPAVLVFFNDTATPEIYTLSLHDALPISSVEAPADTKDTIGLILRGLAQTPGF